jgi:hypothetical protein
MTTALTVVLAVVVVTAAARSTWSPCGLSMLSTITPFGERAKGNSYRTTVAWFITGAVIGGGSLGVAMALAAFGVQSLGLSAHLIGLLALGATLVALASDSGIGGFRLPFHRRQVNERWLDQYRPWVYGAGFGWQIGTGLCTYITTAAVYLMIVLAALTAEPSVALVLGLAFGFLRGIAVLLTRRLTDPSKLRSFHRHFIDAGPLMGRIVITVEAVVAVIVVGLLRTTAGVMVLGLAAVTMAAVAIASRGRGWTSAPVCSIPARPGDVTASLEPTGAPSAAVPVSVAVESSGGSG